MSVNMKYLPMVNGHGKKYKTDFNTDVLVRWEPVRNDFYNTDLFTLECLHTEYITALGM